MEISQLSAKIDAEGTHLHCLRQTFRLSLGLSRACGIAGVLRASQWSKRFDLPHCQNSELARGHLLATMQRYTFHMWAVFVVMSKSHQQILLLALVLGAIEAGVTFDRGANNSGKHGGLTLVCLSCMSPWAVSQSTTEWTRKLE